MKTAVIWRDRVAATGFSAAMSGANVAGGFSQAVLRGRLHECLLKMKLKSAYGTGRCGECRLYMHDCLDDIFCGLNGRGRAHCVQHASQCGLPLFESSHPSIEGFPRDIFSRGLTECMDDGHAQRDIFKRAPDGLGIYGQPGQKCRMQAAERFSAALYFAPSAANNTVAAVCLARFAAFGRPVENKASESVACRTGNLFQPLVHIGFELLFRVIKPRKRNPTAVPN
jgi:hypothetical protein